MPNIGRAIGTTESGVPALVVRDDALATLSEVDAALTVLRVDSTGRLWIAPLGAGSAIIGKVGIDQTTLGTTNLVESRPYCRRNAGVLHRSAITAVDKLATPADLVTSDVTTQGSLLADTTYKANVAAYNRWGPTVPASVQSRATAADGNNTHMIKLVVAEVTGADGYDLFMSTDAAPLWVARITEAQRLLGGSIHTVGGALKGDLANDIATKIRTVLNATTAITTLFTVGGTAAAVTLTTKSKLADDATLNIAIATGTASGITAAPTSANTTAGILAVQQIETASVAATITTAGNGTFTVTASGMGNSPKAISVGVELDDDGPAVAGKARSTLGADEDVAAFFTVGGEGADIVLTAKAAAANDATMNIAMIDDTCVGITPAATSADTEGGVAGQNQVETATVVGEITASGNAAVTVVADGMETQVLAVPVVSTGTAGEILIDVVGTGAGTNHAMFAQSNAFRPDNAAIVAVNCAGRSKAHIHAKLAVTDLRGAATLTILPFFGTQLSAGDWFQSAPIVWTPLAAVDSPLCKDFELDVDGATALKVLVSTITGQGAAASIWVELA